MAIVPEGFHCHFSDYDDHDYNYHPASDNGGLKEGDLLVSYSANSLGRLGQGTTVMKIDPVKRRTAVFFQSRGLASSALAFLKAGFVLVGNAPIDYTLGPPMARRGVIQVLNCHAKVVAILENPC